jgi:hypothetical protein
MNEEKREQLARYLATHPREMQRAKVFLNQVARSEGGVTRLVPREDSTYNKMLGKIPAEVETYVPAPPPVVKRSNQDRLDSMIRRLVDLPQPLLEAKLREVHGEFWKVGMPVAYDDLKRVASQYMNSRQVNKNKPVPNVRATSTRNTGGK